MRPVVVKLGLKPLMAAEPAYQTMVKVPPWGN